MEVELDDIGRKNARTIDDIEWFHPTLSRHLAESLLMQNGVDGTFLLRPSSVDGEFALSVRCMESVKHFPIRYNDGQFKFGMATFNNLIDLQNHFEKNPLIGARSGVLTVLKFPYSSNIQEPSIYDTVQVQAEYGIRKSIQDQPDFSIASKEGFLTKQGSVVKNWKTRWFVLMKHELKYFKSNQDSVPKRTLDLRECTEVSEDHSIDKKHAFKLVFPSRTFHCYASSGNESKEWIDILQWKLNGKTVNCFIQKSEVFSLFQSCKNCLLKKHKGRTATETSRNSFNYD